MALVKFIKEWKCQINGTTTSFSIGDTADLDSRELKTIIPEFAVVLPKGVNKGAATVKFIDTETAAEVFDVNEDLQAKKEFEKFQEMIKKEDEEAEALKEAIDAKPKGRDKIAPVGEQKKEVKAVAKKPTGKPPRRRLRTKKSK